MLGILYGLTSLFLKGTAEIVETARENRENIQQRELNINNWDQTYIDCNGYRRDCKTNVRVGSRINHQNDEILYELIGKDYSGKYKDLRNLSEIKRKMEFEKNVKKAKEEGKTVAKKYYGITYNFLNGYIKLINTGDELYDYDINKVPTHKKKKIKIIQKDKMLDDNIMVYYDFLSNEDCVVKKFSNNKKYYKRGTEWFYDNNTYFYVSIRTGKIIRRTDNQIANDKINHLKNSIPIEETQNFINRFNEMQELEWIYNGIINYNNSQLYYSSCNGDCYIFEEEKKKNIINI